MDASRSDRRWGLPPQTPLVVGVVLLLAATACTFESDDAEGEYAANADGFVIEPADTVGPDAFTAPVDTAPVDEQESGGCDPELLVAELESRDDARREWAAVLGVAEEDVADYIRTLEPRILEEDTAVTNHGLRDGRAYSRPSVLEQGTAVLVDEDFTMPALSEGPAIGLPPQVTTTTRVPTTLPTTLPTTAPDGPTTTRAGTTTVPEEGQPVTRCRCGNPLLPPYAPSTPTPSDTTTTTVGPTPTEPTPTGPTPTVTSSTTSSIPEQPPLDTPEQPPEDIPEQPPEDVPEQPPLDTPEQPPLDTPGQPPLDSPEVDRPS